MAEWKFARRQDRCSACERAFEELGENVRHVSALSIAGEDLTREDVCLACWGRRQKGSEIFYWYTRRVGGRGGLRLDLAMLEQLFSSLEGREESRMLELRYLLCLLLMRKKRLKLVRITREPRETMIVRRPRREESLAVAVCDFAPQRIEEMSRELTEIFEGAEAAPAEGDPSPEQDPSSEADEVPPALGVGA